MVAPRIDTLLEIKEHVAAYAALMSGQFEAEIKELLQIKKDIDAQASLVDTKKKLDKYKEQADQYYSIKFDEAEELTRKLKEGAAGLDERIAAHEKAVAAFSEKARGVDTYHAQKEAEYARRFKALEAQEAILAAAGEANQQQVESLIERSRVINERESALNRKLEAIRAAGA